MFVQRFAKALAAGVSLLITLALADFSTIHWLSLLTVVLVAVWAFVAPSRIDAASSEGRPKV